MSARLRELGEFYDPDPGLVLPINGKDYKVLPASINLAIWCKYVEEVARAARTGREPVLPDQRPPDPPPGMSFEEWMLRGVYAEMVADNVLAPVVKHAARTAYVWIALDDAQAAEHYWETGWDESQEPFDPEGQGPVQNRAQRRAAQRTGGNRTGEVSGTPSPANSSGTRSRRRSKRRGGAPRTG